MVHVRAEKPFESNKEDEVIAAFFLSMPTNNAWNGKWSGEGRLYVVTRRVLQMPDRTSYAYSFGDGWTARIDVKKVDSKESARLKRKSVGFAGYEWMIDSIFRHGEIKS